MLQKTASRDMTRGSVWKHLITFSGPILLGQLFQQLYSTVDSIIVGQYVSKEALAAVGATNPITNALIGLLTGISSGAGVVISRHFGSRNDQKMQDAVHTIVLVILIASVCCTLLGTALSGPVLQWIRTPADVYSGALTYLRIYFIGISGLMLYNMGSGILRAVGDSKRPLYFLLFSSVCNVVLDLFFVRVLGLGIAGAAYATLIAQLLSAVLTFMVLCSSRESYRFSIRKLRLVKSELKPVFTIGMPAGLQSCLISLSSVVIQSYINSFQADCMAGWTAYNRLDAFAWLPINCFSVAITTFVSQNLGNGNAMRIRKGVRAANILAMSCTAVIVLVLMTCTDPLLRLFNDDPEVIRCGRMFVLSCSPFLIPYCAALVFSGALRGIGDSLSSMIIYLFSFVLFRQLFLLIGTRFISSPLFVGLCYPAGWILAIIPMTVTYYKKIGKKGSLELLTAKHMKDPEQ